MTPEVAHPAVDFVRRSLAEGKGEWWIVGEVKQRWQIEEPDARGLVAAISPSVYQRFLWRRRAYLMAGVVLVILGALPGFFFGWDRNSVWLGLFFALPGAALVAFGWPGLGRRPKGDAPTSIPGKMNPISPGLGFRRDPFDWK